jgi:hypothetical protein
MENTLFHSLFLQALSRSVSPCCSHGGVAFFYIQAQSITDPHLGALNKQKKPRNRLSPAETIFVASIISSSRESPYRKFNSVETFPCRPSLSRIVESLLLCFIQGQVSQPCELRGGKTRAKNSVIRWCKNRGLYSSEAPETSLGTGTPITSKI